VDQQWSKIFGAHVRLRRVQMGFLTQQSLAESLGFASHVSIAQIEMGNIAAHFDIACQLASFLHISLDAMLGLPSSPTEGPPSQEWYSDMFMVRLPAKVHELWTQGAQQEILTRTVEEMGRAMRETMHGEARQVDSAQDPEDGTAGEAGPGPGPRPIRPSGTE
jgi:DNA-binding XRE family transcriptional regulator